MYRKLVLFVLMFIILWACKSSSDQKISSKMLTDLHTHLMELHDSSMAKHGVSLNLIDQLNKKKLATDSAGFQQVDSLIKELDASNESMMDWMAGFNDPITQDSAALNYLEAQILFMKNLSQTQTSSIAAAKLLLEEKK